MQDEITPQQRETARWMCQVIHQGIVDDLLQGNDTQCFTTEQYRQKYDENWTRKIKGHERMPELRTDLAILHLQGLATVREVRPGVWTLKDATDMPGGTP